MSQTVYNLIDPNTTSGSQLAQILNDFKDAVISGFIGPSRPSEIDPGGYWIDNSQEGTLNVWDYKIFNGTSDITVFRLNLATGKPSISGSDNTFEVTRISADAVGPLFKLIKKRIANNGQTLFGDVLGEIQFLGGVNDLTTVPTAKIRAIALDNYTSLEQGAAIVFETTSVGSNAIEEAMRIFNGNLGLGLVNPSEKLTVSGNIKGQRVLDDANPAKSILKKGRVSGGGQVLNNDYIGQQTFVSTDETGSEIEVAKIEVKATQDHFGSQQGSALSISTKNNNSAVYTEKLKIDNSGVTIDGTLFNSTNVQLKSEKGAANGYAPLDATSKIDTIYLPSYVDDVVEYANLAAFPVTGESGKIYVAIDTGKTYRWSGSAYVEISPSEVNSVAGKTGIVTLDKNDVGLSNVDNTSDATKNSAVATLTNKTIQGANIQDPTRLDVKKDTYANLVTYATTATNGQLCFATDTKAMYQVVDNVLTEVGGSGSGVGEKNFIANFNFETNLNGWATYKDADQATPENGTGGTPNVTISRSTTSPISGGASLLFSKAGTASRRGEGFSYDFTIDNEAKAKVITIRFDYQIVSGTYADNDITFWIYDVTNGTLIQPTAFQLKNTGIIDRATMEFQSNFSSTSYRLIAHIASTTTQDFVLRFDNIFVGRGSKSYGSVATDWVSFTPTGSWTTNTTYSGKWRRIGDTAEFEIKALVTGTPTASNLRFTLPFSWTIDTSKTSNDGTFGIGYAIDTGTLAYAVRASNYSSNQVVVQVVNTSATYSQMADVTNSIPFSFASGDYVTINFRVPIQGWSSSQQLSQDADTRVIAAYAYAGGTTSLGTSATEINLSNKLVDDVSGFSGNVYTVKVSGHYKINGSVRITNTSGSAVNAYVRINAGGGTYDISSSLITASQTNSVVGSILLPLKAGQTIQLAAYLSAGTGTAESGAWTSLSIERISGPSQIAASETVSTILIQTSGQIIPNNLETVLLMNVKNQDTHNAYNTATGLFTAPASGTYQIAFNLTISSNATGYRYVSVRKNGTGFRTFWSGFFNSGTGHYMVSGTTNVQLLQGETLSVAFFQDSGGNLAMVTSPNQNGVSIHRIGNY